MKPTTEDDILAALSAPFEADDVDWRVGTMTKDKTKGLALAYCNARTVMARLDEVMGGRWRCRYEELRTGASAIVICVIGIKIGEEWVERSNGAGDTDIEAQKGALSDAFKRAAVLWGIGRYLYGFPSPWVRLDEYKHMLRDELPRLRAVAAEALAEYRKNPRMRAAAPEAEPGSNIAAPPDATTAKPVQQGPGPVKTAAPRDALQTALAELRGAGTLADKGTVLNLARKNHHGNAEAISALEIAYGDEACKVLANPGINAATIEAIRAHINRVQPRAAGGKIKAALAQALAAVGVSASAGAAS